MKTYYIDNYTSGSPRDIRGPFATLAEVRRKVSGVKVRIDPYEVVVEDLEKHGVVSLVEAWSQSEDSEGYQAIYAVTAE